LRWTIISLVYFLPGFIAMIVGFVVYIGSIMTSTASKLTDAGALAMFAGMGVYFIALAVGVLLFILAAIPLSVGSAHFVAQDRFGAAFRVREWWPLLKVNKLAYFVIWVVIVGLYSVMSMAMMVLMYSVVLCIVTPFALAPAGLYLSLIAAALFGQTYRDSQELLAPAVQPEASPADPAPNDGASDMATV
jgi:hypothetical protein